MATWTNDKVLGVFVDTERGILRRGRDDVSAMLKRGEAAEHWDGTAQSLADDLAAIGVSGMSTGQISQQRKAFRHYGVDADRAVSDLPDGSPVTPTAVLSNLPTAERKPRAVDADPAYRAHVNAFLGDVTDGLVPVEELELIAEILTERIADARALKAA